MSGLRDARVRPAHDPGDDHGPLRVGDHEHPAVEDALLAVEGDDLFPVGRAADDDLAAGQPAGVAGVQGLPVLEHHEIAGVDDVVDRAEPDRP